MLVQPVLTTKLFRPLLPSNDLSSQMSYGRRQKVQATPGIKICRSMEYLLKSPMQPMALILK